MNSRIFGFGTVGLVGLVGLFGLCVYLFFFGGRTQTQPAPTAVARPISDVFCGHTYQFDHIKRFRVDGQVVVNFHFGGYDRGRRPQYIADKDVLGLSTEMSRTVDRSLEYSTVTVLCLSDKAIEGHRASNVDVLRYRLTLRRPLVPQRVIPYGGLARQ